jgi:hypothetical protein
MGLNQPDLWRCDAMSVKIVAYSFEWSVKNNKGTVHLRTEGNKTGELPVDSMEEFVAVSYVLKNSNEVSYDDTGQTITMAWTPIGS